jgi:Zn-dependent peptidase ImmA (M78 family)
LGLGADEPINVKQLLQKLSILTLYKNLSENFSGMCLKSKEKTFILVNSGQARGRQHFTIAHELYHLFIQKDFKIHKCNPGQKTKDPQEKEADFFASIFLMPEMGVKKMIPESELIERNVSISTIIKLEHYFAVSRSAMLNRLHGLNLISQVKYDELKMIPVKLYC